MILSEKKSTHRVEVVPVVLEPHGNADSLSVVQVYGYTCVVRTSDWLGITRAAYIPPDSVVDVRRPEFSFLAEKANAACEARIKAVRLRGVPSFGLLIPAMDHAIGDEISEKLGVTRYEPPVRGLTTGSSGPALFTGDAEEGPDLDTGPYYDIDSYERNYQSLLKDGELVELSEKLDGANVRYVYHDGRFWVKSRSRWVKQIPNFDHVTVDYLVEKGLEQDKAKKLVESLSRRKGQVNEFWCPLLADPYLQAYLEKNPGLTIFGEIFGNTHRIKYGAQAFRAFDLYRDGAYISVKNRSQWIVGTGIPWVPILGVVPHKFDTIKAFAEGKTTIGGVNVIREGVVIRPVEERWERSFGRVILKCVSPDFLALK